MSDAKIKLEDILKHIEGQRFPPVEKWNPDFCGDIDMRIARDGSWHYMGTPIGRERMVKLFASVLRKDDDGKTYLVTPVEKIGIIVDDAHFIATELDIIGDGENQVLHFTTNVGDKVVADVDHPIRIEEDKKTGTLRPYIKVRGRLEALISRPVFYELAELAEEAEVNGKAVYGLWSSGQLFKFGDR